MRRTTFALMLAVAPGYLAAQGQSTSQPQSQTPSGFSADARIRLEAMLQFARDNQLPAGPLLSVMAEGQAKGASEAQILAATQRTEAALSASQQALVRAGYSQPSDAQVERGARLIVSGASGAQLEAVARQAPSEQRLDVALQVLTDLTAQGVSINHALSVSTGLGGSASGQAGSAAPSGQANPPSGSSLTGGLTGGLGIGLVRKP